MKKIKGVVKHYDWGGFDFLPDLLGREKTGEPFGEYWLGTHPDGMATTMDDLTPLTVLLKKDLPFLLKILDVRNMLSIQLHPDKQTAEAGFEQEEKSGKPRNASDRVYKDENHKPELMVALSEFWLVQGFKSNSEILQALQLNPELKILENFFRENGLEKTYAYIMTMPQDEVNDLLKPLGKRIKLAYERGELTKEDINFWAARAFITYSQKGVCDRGIFSLYLMNLVCLQPGEGMYQSPGVLHAYMEGQNIECMATSDNVIRGGLTSKHIDIDQLLKIIKFESNTPEIIYPLQGLYPTPAREFKLIKWSGNGVIELSSQAIFLNIGSPVTLQENGSSLVLQKGDAVITTEALVTVQGDPDGLFVATTN